MIDVTFKTKPNKSGIKPVQPIHYYSGGDKSACGEYFNQYSVLGKATSRNDITCPKCKKILKGIDDYA